MHEYSIVQALLDLVEAEARKLNARGVRRIRVRIGALAGVEPDLLLSAYNLVREHSVCQGADLEIRQVEARWACPQCATELPSGQRLQCASCGAAARLAAGDEIILEQVELEVAHV
jgi:hydrogenase nickel incorporation protein HypA/HybF